MGLLDRDTLKSWVSAMMGSQRVALVFSEGSAWDHFLLACSQKAPFGTIFLLAYRAADGVSSVAVAHLLQTFIFVLAV